jgi:hypothetical protein
VFTVLLDEQLTGFVPYLRGVAESDAWRPLTRLVDVRFVGFPDVGLAPGTSDRDVWHYCQRQGGTVLTLGC